MFVYKYLAPERIDVPQRKLIRFTQPAALNDPFELKPFFEAAISREDFWQVFADKPIDLATAMREAYEEAPPHMQAAISWPEFERFCEAALITPEGREAISAVFASTFDIVNAMLPHFQAGIHSEAGKRIGILSVSETPTDELLWAHYADQHRGFLIEFKSDAAFFNRRRSQEDEFYCLRPVEYRDVRTVETLYRATGQDLLLAKGLTWEYEREWRMLAPVDDADEVLELGGDTIYLFALPPKSVKGFVLGARASPALERQLEGLCATDDFRHCRFGRSRLSDRRPRLVLEWSKS